MEGQTQHWVNNFWGLEDAGYHRLMQRMHAAKLTSEEIQSFYRERLAIEQEYSRKLSALAKKGLGSQETGGMKHSLDAVRSTTQSMAVTHENVARQLSEQLLKPLEAFAVSLRDRRKTVEDTMSQLTKAKSSQNSSTEKARSKYRAECNKISGFQAQQNLLMGRELDRNNQKLDRSVYQVEGLQRQYQESLKTLAQTMETWNSEWRVSCDKLEQLEDERLTFVKSNLWAYANAVSAACVADDEGCESVRVALERCDPVQDLEQFSREFGTGGRIQDPPEFVNFLQGFSRDNDADDGHYRVANFGSKFDDTQIPDLAPAAGSMSQSSSPHLSSSPQSTGSQFSPASSVAASPEIVHKQDVKKRRSWAMPFKRKSNPDLSFQFSALDQPSPAASTSASHLEARAPAAGTIMATHPQSNVAGMRYPYEPHASQAPEASYAQPSSSRQSRYDNAQHQQPQQQQQQQIRQQQRHSWAPVAAVDTASGEDPLLQALEKLKTPNLKPRPKSTVDGSALHGSNGPPSPYGNGTPARFETVAATPVSSPPRKQQVHRKQVGSDDSSHHPQAHAGAPAGRARRTSQPLPRTTSDGRTVIRYTKAQYDYRAAIPEEVSFRKGDILLITEMQEDGWWDSEVHGRHEFGLAPSNFLADL